MEYGTLARVEWKKADSQIPPSIEHEYSSNVETFGTLAHISNIKLSRQTP
jgi:putative transposon-encoded protein